MNIQSVHARQVLDSRGNPTVEVDIALTDGTIGRAIVPSGASTGRHEALELRDGDPNAYRGKGVLQAVENVNTTITAALKSMDVSDQSALDTKLLALDGTPDKSLLGANSLLGASLAAAVAAAKSKGQPLYKHIAELFGQSAEQENTKYSDADDSFVLPIPMVNILSGGLHAGGQIDIQDFLFVPIGSSTYSEAIRRVFDVYHAARDILKSRGHEIRLVADEGGLGPNLSTNEEALEVLTLAIERAGLEPNRTGAIAIDVASTHFYNDGVYRLAKEERYLDSSQMVEVLSSWVEQYPIISIEDGLAEDDWSGWEKLTKAFGSRIQVLGDDLFTTSVPRIEHGIQTGVGNAVLIKFNQVGTLTETLDAIRLARKNGYRTVVSARSGETEDTFMVDLAVGTKAGQIKIGSITRSERLAKYNQLFRLEEELGALQFCSQILGK